ncbi:hypothetical protein MNBD_NITROSPINAE02-1802 [hydrothermal vent metagenome]|uniref:FlgO domain-containing protein n=1 Tax=hydrothermal vent metagenome TaxID=652676 RepID=A0A3B1CAU3_9ZZZZ
MNKKVFNLAFICCAFVLPGCGGVMVSLGLSDPPPTITDSQYFNTQVDQLLLNVEQNQSRKARKAAVLNFVNADGQVSSMGKFLTTKFSERVMAKGLFKITPPGQVREALERLKIKQTGELTRLQLSEIGKELGTDAIVTGVVSDLQKGSDVDLSVKIIQSASGELLSAASVNIYRSKQVQSLLKKFE